MRASFGVLPQVALAAALAVSPLVRAATPPDQSGGIGSVSTSQVYFVPWKVLNDGAARAKGSLIVYWIPLSRDDMKHSELLTSRPLTIYASQCVGMQLVRPDDQETIEKLGATDRLPIVVLTDASGRGIAKVEPERGMLRVASVERMVRDELDVREQALIAALEDARKKLGAGERQAAIELYRKCWDQRCLFPRRAKEAQKALKKLGVAVEEDGAAR